MFNSRTCQLILGAGALQLVGLKTITTKNLALASRCLQLIIHFIPLIRNHFTNHLSVKQTNMLKHFDSVLKVSPDFINESLHLKLFIYICISPIRERYFEGLLSTLVCKSLRNDNQYNGLDLAFPTPMIEKRIQRLFGSRSTCTFMNQLGRMSSFYRGALLQVLMFQDYNDHVAEIANKLLAIMDSMVEMQLSKVSSKELLNISNWSFPI